MPVEVDCSDEMVQWTAIEDSSGARVYKGSPGGAVDLAARDYRLLAKVRARSTVSAPLAVAQPLNLRNVMQQLFIFPPDLSVSPL